MIAIIVENEAEKAPHVENLTKNGYAAAEIADLYIRGSDEVLLLTKGALYSKNTLFLDFLPQIACKLNKHEHKVVDYIRLRHLGSISCETNPKEPILRQLFS